MSLSNFNSALLEARKADFTEQSPFYTKAHLNYHANYHVDNKGVMGIFIILPSGHKLNIYLYNALRLLDIDIETIEWIDHGTEYISLLHDKVEEEYMEIGLEIDSFRAFLVNKALPALANVGGHTPYASAKKKEKDPNSYKEVI